MGEPIHIYDVVAALGLEARPGVQITPGLRQASFKCPVCQHRGYTMSVSFEKDVFVCPKCWSKGGATRLYALVRFGEDYSPKSERGKEIVIAMKKELGIDDGKKTLPRMQQQQQFLPAVAEPASDDRRDRVYRAIMAMPELALSPEHREHLLKRGLRPEHMGRYRTIPAKYVYFRLSPEVDAAIKQAPVKLNRDDVGLGLLIASRLQQQGIGDFAGVPGFFKIAGQWCFYVTPGILIPTRNQKGQIVCFQVRKQHGSLRYMTLNNKCLPCSVQDGIARCHVVTNLRKNDPRPYRVLLTEGPLKADVIAALSKEAVIVLAIQGIQNTSCLTPIFGWLKRLNVQTVYNCLDMDRITNSNVRSGSVRLCAQMRENGFAFPAMVWDEESAVAKVLELRQIAVQNGVLLPPKTGNPFTYLCNLCIALENAGITHSEKPNYWPERSKGYDDWLRYLSTAH